jgi:hypothetical protein
LLSDDFAYQSRTQIAGILDFGPIIELTFPIGVGVSLGKPLTFRSGFKLSVPDHSQLNLNFGYDHISNSTGFNETNFEMLPFDTNIDIDVDDLDFHFEVGFRPRLVLAAGVGANFADRFAVTGGVGAYLDLPTLNADVLTLENVSSKTCEPGEDAEEGKYVRVNASATVNAGVFWDMSLDVGTVQDMTIESSVPLPGIGMPLDSQCFKRAEDGKGLVNAESGEKDEGKDGAGTRGYQVGGNVVLFVSLFATLIVI